MKAIKGIFLISAISLFDPANSRGQLLNGKAIGEEEGSHVEKFEEKGSTRDNLKDIDKQIEEYALLQKKIDAENPHTV